MLVDYARLASSGASPKKLADEFIRDFFGNERPSIPVNPFNVLRELGVPFSFRNFSHYEGVYIPAESQGDFPVVGINAEKPITRQRYTAAHELCHHIKDAEQGYMCPLGAMDDIERYAESFAAELLMPRALLNDYVELYGVNGKVSLDAALKIADHFGVSFAACVNQLAYTLRALEGDIEPSMLKQRRNEFAPMSKRAELGMTNVGLYRQLFDVGDIYLRIDPSAHTKQIFETEFVFHDSRMEGLTVDREKAAELVVGLRLQGLQGITDSLQHGGDQGLIEVAGLASVYEWIFDKASKSSDIAIYDIHEINRLLFSFAQYPEFAGKFRQSNTLITGGDFETVDFQALPQEYLYKSRALAEFLESSISISSSEYIERVIDLHHELTVIHPYKDGNGRSIRAFTNLLLLARGLPPVLFKENMKDRYKDALSQADQTGSTKELYELYYSEMVKSHAVFTGYLI